MRRIPLLSSLVEAGLVLAALAAPAGGQTGKVPTISARTFVAGSITMTVSGSLRLDQEVAINTQASISDGGMTWLQYGASGSEAPNALITYQPGEVGVSVGKGKVTVIAGNQEGDTPQCPGEVKVTPTSITGHYTCRGVTMYDAATGKMGKVDMEVRFTATS